MLVYGPAADVAAAGEGYLRALIFAQKGADKIVGCPDFADELIVHRHFLDPARVDFHRMAVYPLHRSPDLGDRFQKHINIPHIRQVIDHHVLVRHNRSCQNSKSGIFRPADVNFTHQGIAAFHNILFHPLTSDQFHLSQDQNP